MLSRFGANHARVVEQLRALAAAQAYREARRVAHTLKGAAATLGGTVIAQCAEQVEALMLQSDETAAGGVAGSSAQLDAAMSRLQAVMQQALPALGAMGATIAQTTRAPASPMSAGMPQSESAEYQALRQLLADNCYAARRAFAALQERLGADDTDWRAAAAAVDALDFAQALVRLDARYPAAARKS
jgi:HPt (histidine-containing phosphotransfer) domain-containing protein